MKRINRFIALAIAAMLLLCATLIGVGAETADALGEDNIGTAGELGSDDGEQGISADTEVGANKDADTEVGANKDGDTDGGMAEGKAADTDDMGANTDKDNGESDEPDGFFAALYEAVVKHAAEIASAAAAICSIALAFAMRRGLTPMLRDALSSVAGSVGKLSEGVRESEERAKEISNALAERLGAAEETVARLSEVIAAIEKERSGEAEEELMREDVLTVMSAQIEMLYDVFMSSALPQYKKDAVGERVSLMRKQLAHGEVSGDEA